MRRVLLLLLLVGCDGLGRPVVGTRPISDGGGGRGCEVTPACRPVRTVDPAALAVPADALAPPVHDDCDRDDVPDEVDNCVGVPNPEQDDEACAVARRNCDLLLEGAVDLVGADLRGCRSEALIEVQPALSLRGADLSCAHLSLTALEGQAYTLDASTEANLTRATLHVHAERSAVVVDVGRSQLDGTFLHVSGGARLRARSTVIANTTLVIEPGGGAPEPSPALEITASDLEHVAIFEAESAWAGRVRVEGSTVRDAVIEVRALDVIGGLLLSSRLRATELVALAVEMHGGAVDTPYGAFSGCQLRDVVFARCEDLNVNGGELVGVDVPRCEPDRLRIAQADVVDSRIAGGLLLSEALITTSVLGDGPTSVVHTEDANVEAVTICDLGAAAFRGGELRCVKCDDHAFMDGTSVCLAGARIYERGCPAIELAPDCADVSSER